MHDGSDVFSVQPRGEHGFTLRVGASEYTALLGPEVLEACRAEAQREIERLTEYLADALDGDDTRAAAGWLFTPDYRRPDDFQGLFGWQFLFKVTERLVANGLPKHVSLRAGVPAWVDAWFQIAGFRIVDRNVSLRQRLSGLPIVHAAWQALRFLADHLRQLPRARRDRASMHIAGRRSVLVKIPPTGANARYGRLEPALADAGWKMLAQDFDAEGRGNQPADRWQLQAWLSLNAVFGALADAVSLNRRLAGLAGSGAYRAIAHSPAFRPSTYAMARRMLQRRLWNAALKAGKPDAAVLVTSLTRPEDRMLITCLKKHDVPVCQVLPRPLNPDRPAEKLLQVDLDRPSTLPEIFIVRDGQSRDELVRQGIEPQRIRIAVSESTAPAAKAPATVERTRILVLLTVLRQANTDLCRILADALADEREIEVIVRCHPGLPLDDEQRAALNRLAGGWREESELPIAAQVGFDTLALTPTSTAAIEAARHGAAVVWAPFLSEIALFQQRFMRQLGKIATDGQELTETLQALTADKTARHRLADECREAAKNKFSATETIPNVIVEWLEGL